MGWGRGFKRYSIPRVSQVCPRSPDLVPDGGVGGQDDAVLNEPDADPSGRPQLFRGGFEPVTLQLEVPLGGGVHGTCREVQLPAERTWCSQVISQGFLGGTEQC